MLELGALKREDPRKVWGNEALDFTPWIAHHLNLLGEELGFDMERIETEAPVGDFSLDILARDLGRNRLVVIENQLTGTDHDHLGKTITYASGYDASVIVWLAVEFRDEHRQALDWLNQHTDKGIEFFGVVVEVLQIDSSRLAPHFRIVAAPNEWRKGKVEGSDEEDTERGKAYRAFFQGLIDELREKHRFTGARAAQPQSWYSFSSGNSNMTYGACFGQGDRCRAEIYIDTGDKEETKQLFDNLLKDRDQIEKEFGEQLIWERIDAKRASRIAVYRSGRIDVGPQQLQEIHLWLVEMLLRLKKVFSSRIENLAD